MGLLGAWRISIRALDEAPPRAALGSGSDGAFAFRVTATFHIKDVPTEAAVRQDAASGVTETTYTDEFGFVDGQIAVEFGSTGLTTPPSLSFERQIAAILFARARTQSQ